MSASQHVLVVPVAEGGTFVFAHALDGGIRVWMQSPARQVDEHPRRLRGVAVPLYGGSLTDREALADFVWDFIDHADDGLSLPLVPGRIRDVRPLGDRTNAGSLANQRFFRQRVFSPLHTLGPWNGAAPELLFSQTRRTKNLGFFATGIPELPINIEHDAVLTLPSAAVIGPAQAERLATFLATGPDDQPFDPENARSGQPDADPEA